MSLLSESWIEEELPFIKVNNEYIRDTPISFAAMVRWYFAKRATPEMPISVLVHNPEGTISNYEAPQQNAFECILIEQALSYEDRREVIDRFASKFLDGFTENVRIAGKFCLEKNKYSFRGFEDADNHRSVLIGIGPRHRICSAASRYAMLMLANMVPWYPKITKEEMEALISTTNEKPDYELLLSLIQSLEDEMHLSEKKYRAQMNEVFRTIRERKVKSTMEELDTCDDQLKDLQSRYAEKYKRFLNLQDALEGYRIAAKKSKDANELIEFIDSTPGVRIDDIEGHNLRIIVDTEARQWDQDFLQDDLFDNEYCFLWDPEYTEDLTSEEKQKWRELWTDIFINQSVKLMLTASFSIDLDDGEVSGYSSSTPNHLPNPHLSHWGCMGQNATTIQQHIMNGDVIYAIQYAIGVTAQLNFHDGTVMSNFCDDLLNTNIPCLITEDGESITPSEYMERM